MNAIDFGFRIRFDFERPRVERPGVGDTIPDDAAGAVLETPQAPVRDGFRSPATANAVRRFADRLLSEVDPERRDEAESLIANLVDRIREAAGGEEGPYGRSVEHEVKRMLNDPALKKALRRAAPEATEAPYQPEPEQPPVRPEPVDSADPVVAADSGPPVDLLA